MKVYVTKYGLTKGIYEYDASYIREPYVFTTSAGYEQKFVLGHDAFLTYAEAIHRVCSMILRKQKSLNKHLVKLMTRLIELDTLK